MLLDIPLGQDLETGENVTLPPENFPTHCHFIGATGAGKTVAAQVILRRLMKEPTKMASLFIFDPFGNLSQDLLRWASWELDAPQHVRDRIVYVRFADHKHILPFNPLIISRPEARYYHLVRAIDVLLRAWDNADLTQQPRLFQWTYKGMKACEAMRYPIAIAKYLVHPEYQEHAALMQRLPRELQHEWNELLRVRGSEPTRILDSTRNRLHPFFESDVLRRIFGTWESRLDVESWIRQRKIVIFDLGEYGILSQTDQNTLGSMLLNEVFATASRLSMLEGRQAVDPCFLFLDEFQRYLNPDIAEALPTMRQKGLRLMLAHQSFDQLEKGEVDLTSMIWQARSRFVFANAGMDADIVADEIAKRTYDYKMVKHEETSLKQLITGHRKAVTNSFGETMSNSGTETVQSSFGYSYGIKDPAKQTHQDNRSEGQGHAISRGTTQTQNETYLPVHETIEEKRLTFLPFEEFKLKIGRQIRMLGTGEAVMILANNPQPRWIKFDWQEVPDIPSVRNRYQELLQQNLESGLFLSPETIDRELERLRGELLGPERIRLTGDATRDKSTGGADPFREG